MNKTENMTGNQIVSKDQYEFEGIDHQYLERLSKISAKHRDIMRDTLEEFHRNKK